MSAHENQVRRERLNSRELLMEFFFFFLGRLMEGTEKLRVLFSFGLYKK